MEIIGIGNAVLHSQCWRPAYQSSGFSRSKKAAEGHVTCSCFVTIVVSVLGITIAAASGSAEQAEPMKEHTREVIERRVETSVSDSDYRSIEQYKAQTPQEELQTDRAMQQSSKALEESARQRGNER